MSFEEQGSIYLLMVFVITQRKTYSRKQILEKQEANVQVLLEELIALVHIGGYPSQ